MRHNSLQTLSKAPTKLLTWGQVHFNVFEIQILLSCQIQVLLYTYNKHASHACGWCQEGHSVIKTLLQYSSLTLLKKECCEEEVQPYRKTDHKPIIYI